jgi:RNA polymerase sigma-70 factor, ECF subfamily
MQQACKIHIKNQEQNNELELIASAQKNPLAFRSLYKQYVKPIYRYLYSTTGNQVDAEDLTSQVFLQALENLEKFRNQGGFRSWLFTIARSRAMDHFRKKRGEISIHKIDPVTNEPDILSSVIHQEQIEKMRMRIDALNEHEKELIRLRYVSKLKYGEIGELLNRSEGAIKKQLYRLLERLGEQMESDHAK